MTVAVEGAFERLGVKAIGTCSQHRGDADVVVKLEILAAVVRAGCHVGGQLVPVGGRSDEVWVLGRTVAATKGGCCPRRGDAEQLCKQQQCCATKISVQNMEVPKLRDKVKAFLDQHPEFCDSFME